MTKKENKLFQVGFKAVRKRTEKYSIARAIRCCNNCDYFYSDKLGEEEVCHNNGVTSFDMTRDESSGKECCTFWTPVGYNKK
jgi:hypothetical protein